MGELSERHAAEGACWKNSAEVICRFLASKEFAMHFTLTANVAPTDPVLRRLRSQYLDSLYEPQDMHSESLLREADCNILRSGDESVAYGFGIAAEIELVANVDGKTLASLDVLSDICAADGRGNDPLNVSHG